MAMWITIGVVIWLVVLAFIGPKLAPYTRKQWALIMATLFVLWIPAGYYLIFVVGSSADVNPQQVARVGALNLLIGVPLFAFLSKKMDFEEVSSGSVERGARPAFLRQRNNIRELFLLRCSRSARAQSTGALLQSIPRLAEFIILAAHLSLKCRDTPSVIRAVRCVVKNRT